MLINVEKLRNCKNWVINQEDRGLRYYNLFVISFFKNCEKFVKMLHELKIIICENVTSFILIFSQKVLIIIISKNVTFLIKYLLVI